MEGVGCSPDPALPRCPRKKKHNIAFRFFREHHLHHTNSKLNQCNELMIFIETWRMKLWYNCWIITCLSSVRIDGFSFYIPKVASQTRGRGGLGNWNGWKCHSTWSMTVVWQSIEEQWCASSLAKLTGCGVAGVGRGAVSCAGGWESQERERSTQVATWPRAAGVQGGVEGCQAPTSYHQPTIHNSGANWQ